MRGIDHTNVISKLEGTQHGSEDSENQGPGDLWRRRHRAGKHEARSATHLLSLYSLDFWQAPLAGSCPLILTPVGSFIPEYESFMVSLTLLKLKRVGDSFFPGEEPKIWPAQLSG